MDPLPTPVGTKRAGASLPRARLTLPLLGLVAAALVGSRLASQAAHPNEAAILGMASARGILPAEEHPGMGTPIFQWDPELHDIAPFYVGAVINPDYPSEGKRYTLVKRPHAKGLYLDIRKGDMRYWIAKDKKRP